MSVFTWKESYVLGIKALDDQHRQLVQMINDLHEALVANQGQARLQAIVGRMVDYTDYHFRTEEAYLERHGYGELESQRREHAAFTAKAHELKERVEGKGFVLTLEVIRYLRDWLNDHILGSDRRYAPFLLGRGVR